MKSLLIALLAGVSVIAVAHEHKHEHKAGHKAHVHGEAKVTVAFEGMKGKIELEIPAESLLGFEHKPKNPTEEKKVSDGLAKLESSIGKMLVFAADLKCSIKKENLDIDYQAEGSGTHADVDGDFSVECAKSPVGTKVQLSFFQPWMKAKSFETQFLLDNVQKSFKHTKNGQNVELK